MTNKRRHEVELHVNSIGLHKCKCSCGMFKQFTNPSDMRRHVWIHTRDIATNLVTLKDVYDSSPRNRPHRRAVSGRHNGSTNIPDHGNR